MKRYTPYVKHLENLVGHKPSDAIPNWKAACDAALDGEPSRELRERISVEARRRSGAFFTGSKLAIRLISKRTRLGSSFPVFFDASCGAGDLLIAAAKLLPIKKGLYETLKFWGTFLTGCDKHEEFVRATRARLALLAVRRSAKPEKQRKINLKKLFPKIRVGDGLRCKKLYSQADCIILNPPFGKMSVPKDCNWAKGQVTSAALFLERSVRLSKANSKILAILPDVLRSGTRYERWRKLISKTCKLEKIRIFGLFDDSADIDVFMVHLLRKRGEDQIKGKSWIAKRGNSTLKVSNYFEVHVGPVVPHRHKQKGALAPYIHARSVPPWKRLKQATENRRFSGTLYAPPFVVIRRTSRPGDQFRAIATMITLPKPVAVENHLIICQPKDRRISTCAKLLRQLKTANVNRDLNDSIRCRHLTVSSIKKLPFSFE